MEFTTDVSRIAALSLIEPNQEMHNLAHQLGQLVIAEIPKHYQKDELPETGKSIPLWKGSFNYGGKKYAFQFNMEFGYGEPVGGFRRRPLAIPVVRISIPGSWVVRFKPENLKYTQQKTNEATVEIEDTILHELIHLVDPQDTLLKSWKKDALPTIAQTIIAALVFKFYPVLFPVISGLMSGYRIWRQKRPQTSMAEYLADPKEKTAWTSALSQRFYTMSRQMTSNQVQALESVDPLVDKVMESLPAELLAVIKGDKTDYIALREFLQEAAEKAFSIRIEQLSNQPQTSRQRRLARVLLAEETRDTPMKKTPRRDPRSLFSSEGDAYYDTGHSSASVLWMYVNGKIEKAPAYDEEEDYNQNHTSIEQWAGVDPERQYRGRYDPVTKVVSVIPPYSQSQRPLPRIFEAMLERAFPQGRVKVYS